MDWRCPRDGRERLGLQGLPVVLGDGDALARASVLGRLGKPEPDGCRRCKVRHFDEDGYPQVWWPPARGYRAMHRLLATWEHGEHPRWWDVHHTCGHRWCGETAHLVWMPRAEHKAVHAGQQVLPNAKSSSLLGGRTNEVLELHAQGLSTRQIAARLGCSHETVRRTLAKVEGSSV